MKTLGQVLNLAPDLLEPITGGYQNLVYTLADNRILRVSSDSVRKRPAIESELKWCQSLQQSGISVAKVIDRPRGDWVHTFEFEDQTYHAVVFEKALGRKLAYPEYLNNTQVFELLGQTTGQIHAHSKIFSSNNSLTRPIWHENVYIKQFKQVVPESKKEVHRAFDELVNRITKFKQTPSQFGLIHGDINVGNFHYDDYQLTLFDFDECQWSWYVEDIAIQLFYTLYPYGEDARDERVQQGRKFMTHFLKAYLKETHLDESDLRLIPDFMKLREMIMYVGICKKWDFSNLNAWQADYYKDTESRIREGRALIEIDEVI